MAVIAPFLQRQLYDDAVTEMADELRLKADILESSDSETTSNSATGARRRPWELPKGHGSGPSDAILVPSRSGAGLVRRRKGAAAPSGPDKVSKWLLSSTDWSRQFLRASGGSGYCAMKNIRHSAGVMAGMLGSTTTGSGAGAGSTRHVVAYEYFGNWWLRFNLRGRLETAFPVLSPVTRGRTSWDVFILVLVLYSAVTVPLAFSYGLPHSTLLSAVEWALTALYVVDIAINFRTAHFNDDGNMVRDTWPVAKHYLKTWFPVDFLATVPFDAIGMAAGLGSKNEEQLMVLAILKTPRLLRLIKLMRLLDRIRNANIFKVVQLILLMMMIAHWLACIWYFMARYASGGEDWGFNTMDDGQKLSCYLSSFYFSFLLLIGDNVQAHNNYERLFFVLALIAGACFYSAVVGNMALLVANMNTVAVRFRQRLDMTQDALRYMHVPETHRERVQAFYDFITQFSHPGSEGLGFLSELTKGINEDLHIFLHTRVLKRIYLFKDCEMSFIRSLAMRMKIVTFIPREIIFRQGDLGHEMYIIRAGCVAVVSKKNEVMGLLQVGDFFGEIALLTQARRTAECIALGNCDLAILNSFDIKFLMKEFPESASKLQEAARERLHQLKIAGRAGNPTGNADAGSSKEEEKWPERNQRRGSIARFATGRTLHPSKLQSPDSCDDDAEGEPSCSQPTSLLLTASGVALAKAGAGRMDKCGSLDGTTVRGKRSEVSRRIAESSCSSFASLGTQDSARELVERGCTTNMTSSSCLPAGASALGSSPPSPDVDVAARNGPQPSDTVVGGRIDQPAGPTSPCHTLRVPIAIDLSAGSNCGESRDIGSLGETKTAVESVGGSDVGTVSLTRKAAKTRRCRRSSTTQGLLQDIAGDGRGCDTSAVVAAAAATARTLLSRRSSLAIRQASALSPPAQAPNAVFADGAPPPYGVDLEPQTHFDDVERFQPPAPPSGSLWAMSASTGGISSVSLTEAPKPAESGRTDPWADNDDPEHLEEQVISTYIGHTLPSHAKLRLSASPLLVATAGTAIKDQGEPSIGEVVAMGPGLAAAVCEALSESNSRQASNTSTADLRALVMSPSHSFTAPQRERHVSTVSNHMTNCTVELSPAVAAAMVQLPAAASITATTSGSAVIVQPLHIRAVNSEGHISPHGRSLVSSHTQPTGSFACALAATAAIVAVNGAPTAPRTSHVDYHAQCAAPLAYAAATAPATVATSSNTELLPVPCAEWNVGTAALSAPEGAVVPLQLPVTAAAAAHIPDAQGPYCMMRSAAARRAEAVAVPAQSDAAPWLRSNYYEELSAGSGGGGGGGGSSHGGLSSPQVWSPFRTTQQQLSVASDGRKQARRSTGMDAVVSPHAAGHLMRNVPNAITPRTLRRFGSAELLRLEPPSLRSQLYRDDPEGGGGGGGTSSGLQSSCSGGGGFPGGGGGNTRLHRSMQMSTARMSLQIANTYYDISNTNAVVAMEFPPEDVVSALRHEDGINEDGGGEEAMSRRIDWIGMSSRGSTAKTRRQRRLSSCGIALPIPQRAMPHTTGGGGGGNSGWTAAQVAAEFQRAEVEHCRREAELARREAELERREADLAQREAEAAAALAEAARRQAEAVEAIECTRSVHLFLVALVAALSDLSYQVEQLDARLNGADLAVRRIEAQHGHGWHGSNEFLGLGKHGVLPPLADQDAQPNISEHGANPEKRLTVLERTKMLSGRSTGSMTAAISGLSASSGRHSGGADSSVHGGRRAETGRFSSNGFEPHRRTAVDGNSSVRGQRASVLRPDIVAVASGTATPPLMRGLSGGRAAASFTTASALEFTPSPHGNLAAVPSSPSMPVVRPITKSFTAGAFGSGIASWVVPATGGSGSFA